MPTINFIDFKVNEKAIVAIPKLKEVLKKELENLNVPEESLEPLLATIYREGFIDGINEFKDLLISQGFIVN